MTAVEIKAKEIIEDLPTAIIRWYPFEQGSKVLLIGEEGAVAAMLRRSFGMQLTVAGIESVESICGEFEYIVCLAWLEMASEPVKLLAKLRKALAENGVLLLGMNNRFGIRYFCGDHDPYTHRAWDGIENYRLVGDCLGRMYARSEMEAMLREAGWNNRKIYSVLSNLENPVLLFAEGQLPKENLVNRIVPTYNHPQGMVSEEEFMYHKLADNGMFHAMANAYLIECSPEGKFADALYVTSSLERGKDNATVTVIHENGTVSKEAAYLEGEERLKHLDDNIKALRRAGVPVVEGRLDDGRYVMPYIEGINGHVYLRELLRKDKDKFIEAMDAFREEILSSSPTHWGTFDDASGNIREAELFDRAFLDMVPLNSFFLDGKFVFFDQEFSEENYPVGLLLSRMIASFYAGNDELGLILPMDDLYARYGLLEMKNIWLEMEWAFLRELRQEEPLAEYHSKVRREWGSVRANRKRMNNPADEYRRVFLDIFENAGSKKFILFGSGKYAREFMDLYRVLYPVYAIVDNNEKAWGQEIHGVKVQSPEILQNFRPDKCKVLICIKNFFPVIEQLDSMWIEEYSVFDPRRTYDVPKMPLQDKTKKSLVEGKKYHIGYVAGVFDLFHIGHLNILRRAKEHCDYLIVGVVSDRQVREYKKVEPFVPFEERLDMIRSCRYVDEAHEIPFEHPDTDMAWKLYHFDVQFSGSDYEHDPVWLKKKEWLEERGSTMVFFPYTQSTSSTRLKKLIEERLI